MDQVVDVLERLPAHAVIQRLTGDPHPEELAAPAWSRDKAGTLKAIRETLERRDTWQGKRLRPDRIRTSGHFLKFNRHGPI